MIKEAPDFEGMASSSGVAPESKDAVLQSFLKKQPSAKRREYRRKMKAAHRARKKAEKKEKKASKKEAKKDKKRAKKERETINHMI